MLNEIYEDLSCESKGGNRELEALDSIKLFLDDIREHDLLNAEDEKALAMRIAKGDIAARNELVDSNYRLVVANAKKYTYTGVDLEDLIQAGNIGLIRAAEKFDYTLGYRFSTYATQWILQAIRRTIADNGRTIRVPVHMQEAVSKQNKAIRNLSQKLGREPSVYEIAQEIVCSTKRVLDVYSITPDATSLDMPIGEDGEDELYEIIVDNNQKTPDEVFAQSSMRSDLETVFSLLNEKELNILKLRNGWDDGIPRTLEYIAKQYGLTRERVRQIEANALQKIRDASSTKHLREYLVA